ncbi:hypothetical protein DFJ74DRAFT_672534 [Hyaloraphidium curvatum]|nr:hypothetical protein DFJ74DRAFT_672534 [Hyaloraphidium curvatum]
MPPSLPAVFVIGATGFIGQSVSRLLLFHGYPVLALARTEAKAKELAKDEIRPVVGALDRPEAWADAAAEAEVLLDASQNNDDREGHAKMVERAANLWAQARKAKGLKNGYFLYTSGTGVYGDAWSKLKRPLTESDEPQPPPFVAFRPAFEKRVIGSSDWTGYVIRPGLVYGRGGANAARMIASLPAGSEAAIALPVPPDQLSPTVHVDDLAQAYLAVLERKDDPKVKGQIFNVINAKAEKRSDILDAIIKLNGFKGKVTYREPRTPIEVFSANSSEFDITKARELLGWEQRHTSFADGMARWASAVRAHL